MRPVAAYRRGWQAEAPAGAHEAAIAAVEASAAAAGLPSTIAPELPTDASGLCGGAFVRREDGAWVLTLAAPGLESAADVLLDVSAEALRVTFPGDDSAREVPWPHGVAKAQVEACCPKFLRRRGELVVTLPAPSAPDAPTPTAEEGNSACQSPDFLATADPRSEDSGFKQETLTLDVIDRKVEDLKKQLRSMPQAGSALNPRTEKAKPMQVDTKALDIAAVLMAHSAAATGNAELLNRLLGARASPNAQDELGTSVLEKAVICGSTECVEILLKHGAFAQGEPGALCTPLHRAAALGGGEGSRLVHLLLDKRAKPSVKDRHGRTPGDVMRANGLVVPQELILEAAPPAQYQPKMFNQ